MSVLGKHFKCRPSLFFIPPFLVPLRPLTRVHLKAGWALIPDPKSHISCYATHTWQEAWWLGSGIRSPLHPVTCHCKGSLGSWSQVASAPARWKPGARRARVNNQLVFGSGLGTTLGSQTSPGAVWGQSQQSADYRYNVEYFYCWFVILWCLKLGLRVAPLPFIPQ